MSGKRPESLTLAISTPASSPDSIMWQLVEHGRAVTIRRSTSRSSPPRRGAPPMTVRRGGSPTRRWRAVTRSCPRTASRPPEDDPRAGVPSAAARPMGDRGRVVAAVGSLGCLPVPSVSVQPGERVVLAFDGSASGDSHGAGGLHPRRAPVDRRAVGEPRRSALACPARGRRPTPSMIALHEVRRDRAGLRSVGWRSRDRGSGPSGTVSSRVVEWNTAHASTDGPGHRPAVSGRGDESRYPRR